MSIEPFKNKKRVFAISSVIAVLLLVAGIATAQSVPSTPSTTPNDDSTIVQDDANTTDDDAGIVDDESADDDDSTEEVNSDDSADDGASTEESLTGDVAAQVTTAAEAAVPGGTVLRVETDDHGAAYEAHMTDAAGNPVTVTFAEDFSVIAPEAGH